MELKGFFLNNEDRVGLWMRNEGQMMGRWILVDRVFLL